MKALLGTAQSFSLKIIGAFRTALLITAIWLAASVGSTARAATIIVNTASDGFVIVLPGQPLPCTLRDAISAANTNRVVGGCVKGEPPPVVDTILFNLGTGTPSIKPRTMLPAITEPVYIRGDSYGATRVELNGTDASWQAALLGRRAHGLFLVTGDSTIRNLVINRFNGDGIVLTSDTGGHIEDFTPPTITDPSLPTEPPCFARPAEPDCQLGGGGGSVPPLPPLGGAGARNTIIGCFIGTDVTGTVALGNGSGLDTAGIVTTTDMHNIGGPTAAERNLISGNHGHGIILGGRAQWVRGNFIGTDVNGTQPLGNQFDGINLAGGLFSNATGAIGANLNAADTRCQMVIDPVTGAVLNDRRECGNRIAFNTRNGISSGFNLYTFLSNPIFSNDVLGIDVDQWGVTPNAATRSRNFPVLNAWRREFNLQAGTVGTRVFGSITNSSNQPVVIQFFHSSACDPSNYGEGREYVGSMTLPGNGGFSFYVPQVNGFVTATATTIPLPPKTSEFSSCLHIW